MLPFPWCPRDAARTGRRRPSRTLRMEHETQPGIAAGTSCSCCEGALDLVDTCVKNAVTLGSNSLALGHENRLSRSLERDWTRICFAASTQGSSVGGLR